MRKFIIDFEYNEVSGRSSIVVDFNDDGLTNIEINEAIRSGEILEEVIKKTAEIFGEEVAQQVRDGRLEAICLDNHPELKNADTGILLNEEAVQKQEVKQ
jgi:hypothetical protein